jgi:hypothetical protein
MKPSLHIETYAIRFATHYLLSSLLVANISRTKYTQEA